MKQKLIQTMEKQEDNYSAPNFATLDYSIDGQYHHHRHESTNYLLNNLPQQQQQQQQQQLQLSFADVMQFADFGPKLALNQTRISEQDGEHKNGDDDPVYFLKFPVLNDNSVDQDRSLVVPQANGSVVVDYDNEEERLFRSSMMMSSAAKAKEVMLRGDQEFMDEEEEEEEEDDDDDQRDDMSSVHLHFLGKDHQEKNDMNNSSSVIANPSSSEPNNNKNKNKRKRPRTLKTSEEVESQRMTHIAVERNRRKQMNEHLKVLRSLMPGSYVQRGDQASIIGGAIEFVRELEQLLQCLESQKHRRLFGEQPPGPGLQPMGLGSDPPPPPPPFFSLPSGDDDLSLALPFDQISGSSSGMIIREETAESKSCVADVEVRLLGFDATIKILSRRRAGQLVKAVAALEDLDFNILHTNITTIEQTVLYSFNVKVTSESARFSAEDIASSVQQIFSFIHASTTM